MIPSDKFSNFPEDLESTEDVQAMPSRTYALDLQSKRILGRIDGKEALKQAIFKILATERFAYLIYSTDYGAELRHYMHNPITYARADLPREIAEALLVDDRIIEVDNFIITIQDSTTLIMDFDVTSTTGDVEIRGVEVKAR